MSVEIESVDSATPLDSCGAIASTCTYALQQNTEINVDLTYGYQADLVDTATNQVIRTSPVVYVLMEPPILAIFEGSSDGFYYYNFQVNYNPGYGFEACYAEGDNAEYDCETTFNLTEEPDSSPPDYVYEYYDGGNNPGPVFGALTGPNGIVYYLSVPVGP